MTKLLSITLLGLLTSLQINAQRKGFHIGGNIDMGLSTLFADNADDYFLSSVSLDRRPDMFLSISFNVGGMLNNHIGLFTGVGISKYQWKLDARSGGSVATQAQRQTYVIVPLYLKVITSQPGHAGFFMNVGANACLLTKAAYKISSSNNIDREADNTDQFYGFNVSPFLNLGVSIPLRENGELFIGPKIQSQVVNNFDDTDGSEGYLLAGSLNVGASFRLGR